MGRAVREIQIKRMAGDFLGEPVVKRPAELSPPAALCTLRSTFLKQLVGSAQDSGL
jgi:hypothetical protein